MQNLSPNCERDIIDCRADQSGLNVPVCKVLPDVKEGVDDLVELPLDAPVEVSVICVFVPLGVVGIGDGVNILPALVSAMFLTLPVHIV